MISRGICSVGRRMSVRAGPILLASSEAFHSGATARRKMMMSVASRISRIGMVIHPTRPEEVRDDVVDDDVAVRKILGDADAHRPALDHAAHAGTGNRLGQARRGGIAGLSPRREQHASLGIANVVLVAAIGFRIEALQTVGQIEGQRAVRLRDDALGEHLGLGAHGIAVQLVDLRVEQPEQHQRQEDRNHRDRHDMQEHDARDQRFERRPGE
ncbi:hypothetical protein ABIE88_005035 [Bradyrhizobium diazoefficiens]